MDSLITIIVAIIGSQSLVELIKWISARRKPKPADKLLVALAQDRIVDLGSSCLEHGYMTRSQLTILTSIIKPYRELGGDGLADSIMDRCKHLPLREEADA